MNKTAIEFADWTWNPITGCSFGCPYCYARKFSDRYKLQADFSKPEFHPERLKERFSRMPKVRNRIAQLISPDRPVIFVGSMCDIFDKGVLSEWLYAILDCIKEHPDYLFLLLSKQPIYDFLNKMHRIPENVVCGTSIEKAHLLKRLDLLREYPGRKWVSVEPLMSYFHEVDFSWMEFVVVGAMTGGPKPVIPQKEWALSVRHERVFFKDNILKYYTELK